MTDEEPFTIETDRTSNMIRLTLRGLWDLPTVERYVAAAREALSALTRDGIPPSEIGLLVDLRQQGIQPREVTERIQAALKEGPSRGSRHAVLVSSSTLHRLQAQRVGVLLGASFFDDEAAALAWLRSDPVPTSDQHGEPT